MPAKSLEVVSRHVIGAPADAVWAVLSDVGGWPAWSGVVVDVSRAEPLSVGAVLAYRLRMGPGVPVAFAVTVSDCEPPHRVTWSSRRWTVTGTRTFALTESDGGTEVVDHKRFSHRWAPLAWFYPVGTIERMSRAFLSDLAGEVARRSEYGGDGR